MFFLVLLIITGCATTSPALYSGVTKVPAVIGVKEIKPLKEISIEKKHFNLLYKAKNTQPNADNYINARGSIINLNKLPTVVIALPVENKQQENSAQKLDKTGAFKTEGYINKAEETVEKELIRAGFGVIDRSKFEAKLRTLRESENDSIIQNEVFKAEFKALKGQLSDKKITDQEYADKLATLTKSSKRQRGDKELIDMSELIRAAQSKGVKADYILQLNTIEEYNGYVVPLQIKGRSEVEQYIAKNPDITYGNSKNNIPYQFDTKVFQVVFSAKLFNVNTGQVVWSGSHELNSLDVEDIQASFDVVKQAINANELSNKINSLNKKIISIHKDAMLSQHQLETLFKKASVERKYEDEKIQKISELQLKNNLNHHEENIKKNNRLIDAFNLTVHDYNKDVKYDYLISDLFVKPNLNPEKANLDSQNMKVIHKHRSKLLKTTINSLFKTIKVEG